MHAAEALTPVRQLGSALLAAQDRDGGPRRLRPELGSRDPPDAAVEPGLVEDRLGEIGPGAVAARGDVPDPNGAPPSTSSRVAAARCPTYVGLPRWSSTTATSSRSAPSREHRPDEVVARRAEEPRAAHDPGGLAGRGLGVQLRAPVGGERAPGCPTRRTALPCGRRRRSPSSTRRVERRAPRHGLVPPTFTSAAP